MKKLLNKYLCLLLSCSIIVAAKRSPDEHRIRTYFCSPPMESLAVSDWRNPTYNDYVLIQTHLKAKLANILANSPAAKCFDEDLEGWITYRLGRVQLIDTENNLPSLNVVHINNNPNKKDKCVICYASYNNAGRDYIQGIDYLIKSLRAFNFDGHFIYRIGGWPNLEQDRLKHADVPYAFKPFFFEEVRNMGYKKILWLDSASIPVKSLDPIFTFIEREGCCFFGFSIMSSQKVEKLRYVLRSLGIPEKKRYLDILTQVVGFDLDNPRASELLNRWIEAATRKVPFLEPSGDQVSFAFLAHELNLLNGTLPHQYYQEGRPLNFSHNAETIILHQYDFLNPEATIPSSVFKAHKRNLMRDLPTYIVAYLRHVEHTN